MSMKKKGFEIGTSGAKGLGMTECPICGRGSHCWLFARGTVFGIWDEVNRRKVDQAFDDAVMCMAPPSVASGGKFGGYVALGKPGKNGGQYFVPAAGGVVLSADEVSLRQARWKKEKEAAEKKAAETREYCRNLWSSAMPDHPRVVEYLNARGVPGATSGRLRFLPELAYRDGTRELLPGPAILGCVTNAAGSIEGVHRIYLALDGSGAKREARHCGERGAKLALGSISGGAVRLGGVDGAKTLVLCEGIETGEMIMAASPATVEAGGWEVWSCISGGGMVAVDLDEATAARVTRIVVAGDLDKWDDRAGRRPGHHYATQAAERLREAFPAIDVRVAIPGVVHLPAAVDENGAPRGLGGADWLDVGANDLRRVTSGILNAAADVFTPGKAEWEEARTRASAQGSPDEGDGEAENRTRASDSDSPDGGAGDGEDRTRASAPFKITGSDKDASQSGAALGEDGGGRGTWHDDGYWVEPGGECILPKGDLTRARILIRSLYMPDGARPCQRFTIAWWEASQQWMRFDGKRYEQVHADDLRGDCLHFFEDWCTRRIIDKVNADGTKGKDVVLSRVGLSTHQAASIVEALKTDCTVRLDGVPAWSPPTIGNDGRPLFDTDREVPEAGGLYGRPVIIFKNGMLDLDALKHRREVVLSPHTTLRIATNVMPFELPAAEISRELEADARGEGRGGELCAKLAPNWINYMSAIGKGEDDVPRVVQQYLGYIISPDCDYEQFMMFVGLPGVGKGTIVEVATGLVGRDATAASSLNKISGPFGIAPLVGKNLYVFDEFGAGHSTDLVEATRCFLSIVGNAPQPVNLKNRDEMANVRLHGKAICTCNRLPKFADPSDAFGRRILIVPIPKTSRRADPGFKKKLVAELPGIMVWAIFGLLDLWKAGGFVQPAAGMPLRTMFRRYSSRVAAFVEDCAVLDGSDFEREESIGSLSVKASVIYDLFVRWSESKGMKPLMMEDFAVDLTSMMEGFREDTMTVGMDQFCVWHGVRPRLRIDEKDRAEWTESDRRVSSCTVTGIDEVARPLVRSGFYVDKPPEAVWAPMGFNIEEEQEQGRG